jgi:hypothetical protein
VSIVWKWVNDAISGLWTTVSGAFGSLWTSVSSAFGSLWTSIVGAVGNLWNSISSSIGGLWTAISSSFSGLISWVGKGLSDIWTGLVSVTSQLWNSISTSLGGLWTSINSAVGGIWTSVSGALGNLWTGFISFLSSVADGIHQGINAVGSAVGSAVNTIGSWVSEALKGVAEALGTALSNFVSGIGSTLQSVGGAIVGFVSEHVIAPLLGALNWIRDAIFNILKALWSSIESFFGGHSPITPEEAAGFTVPLLLIGAGAGFGVSVMGAVGSLKALGSGIEARAISDFMESAFALGDISRSIIMPIFSAAYSMPIQYYYNAMFRPRIPDTRTADQMFFEENITEPQWRQIYRYQGWKEGDIDAWYKTMWREPSILVLRVMAADPDTDPAWVLKKLRELGYIGEDAEAIMAYGKRQQLKDERTAMAAQIQYDLVDGAISYDEARADLLALKFSPEEVEYRLSKAYLIISRNERRAAAKLASDLAKASDKARVAAEEQARTEAALAAKKVKKLSESDYNLELELGLTTPERYIADMMSIGYPEDLAKRKYALQITPRPISAAELERRRNLIETRISRTRRRYDFVIARHDLQTGFLADTIEYLSSLEKPPFTRIATLQAQLAKAADEKALILAERDAELAELEAELKAVVGG